MRILQVIPVFSSLFGGPVGVVKSISKELARKHDVTIFTTSAINQYHDNQSIVKEEQRDGYRICFFPRVLRFTGFNISPTMTKAVKDTIADYDVVHLHSWRHYQDLIVRKYARRYSVPFLIQPHGSIPFIISKQCLKLIYDAILGSKVLRDAAKVIALSQGEAKDVKRKGVPDERIAIVPNGIDLSEFHRLPRKGKFRKRFEIAREKRIVLYLGRIHQTKGIDLLVRAYAKLRRLPKSAETLLVIAGPDEGYLYKVESLVNSLGVSESVLTTGFISHEEKLSAFVDADVFVTPSFYGFPVTFLEACSIGVPIITTELGDALEWIDGNVGFVTPPSPQKLAKAIHTIITDVRLRKRFSRNGRTIVETEFSIESVVNKLEKIYEEVAT